MIRDTSEVKPERDVKQLAYPCIFMTPPEPDKNQATVVYSNGLNTQGVWGQYHTAKSMKMTNTDTFGSAFKNNGNMTPSMVKFEARSQ